MSEHKIDTKSQEQYLQSLLDFVNRLPLTKEQKINFISQLITTKEESFVSDREKLKIEEKKEDMPIYSNSETGEKKYADADTLFQSVGDCEDDGVND